MRLTYTDLKAQHFRNIGKSDDMTNTALLADFNYSLGQRYQMIWGSLSEYLNQETLTTSTVASQQYYYYPPGTVGIDSATVLIGSMRYTLTPIYHQYTWNQLNAMQIQPTAIPQFIYPRKDDFGIWPIPQAVYTVEFNRFFRDRNLQVEDYTTGTVQVTAGSQTVVVTSGTFTTAMKGRWFTITDTTLNGQGYWYRISSAAVSNLTLETVWAGDSGSGLTYRIGECPEIPEEVHSILADGTTADYYQGLKNSPDDAVRFDNKFWTGSMMNNSRNPDDKNIFGGLIGLIRKYKDRERDHIVIRQPKVISPTYKVWAQSIT